MAAFLQEVDALPGGTAVPESMVESRRRQIWRVTYRHFCDAHAARYEATAKPLSPNTQATEVRADTTRAASLTVVVAVVVIDAPSPG